ncbi:MAG: hypothetical protein ABWJ97_04145 [Thermoproteus sp.]
MAQSVRDAIARYGIELEDSVVSTMPKDLKYTASQIRSIIETYRNSDISTIITNLSNIKNINELMRYIIILTYLVSYSRVKTDELLEGYPQAFEKTGGEISASKLRSLLLLSSSNKIDNINIHINKLINIIESIENKGGTYIWILKEKRIERFEEDVRRFIFNNNGGNSVDRGIKLFLRIFIDRNNIPLAYRIAYNKEEVRKYRIHGDFYTTLVTLRSGAFEDIRTSSAEKLKQKVAKMLLCRSRDRRCGELQVRLGSVRGLVRSVAYLSGDPVSYERGAYHIGKNYCAKLKCDQCPIRDVCKKYIFIQVK